jgi:type I restriction enzyme M protein
LGDSLEKTITVDKSDTIEQQDETEEMIKYLQPETFNVVLTNPPFSMWYEKTNESQKKIIEEYDLVKIDNSTTRERNRLRGSAMFLERYRDLLKKGGKLITIIDETILSSPEYSYVRNFIRKYFIIRAIISLHGDAFQQSKARVKTAMIYLEKKKNISDQQTSIFMYSSIYLGVDDLPITTKPSKVYEARKLARRETETILDEFRKYSEGKSGGWLVDVDQLSDRLDVKFCLPLVGRFVKAWKKSGAEVYHLSEVCEPRDEIIEPRKDYPNEEYRILTITYDGRCRTDEKRLGKEINYSKMKIVRTGDIVFSEYNAFHGAIGYVTEEFDGALASGSYTVVKCYDDKNSLYLWSILRTTEIRADFLSSAIGMGRQTVSWDYIQNVQIPFLLPKKREQIGEKIINAWKLEEEAQEAIKNIYTFLDAEFNVESELSKNRFLAAKPPR